MTTKKFKLKISEEKFYMCEVSAEAEDVVSDEDGLKALQAIIESSGLMLHSDISEMYFYEPIYISLVEGGVGVTLPDPPRLRTVSASVGSFESSSDMLSPPKKKIMMSPSSKAALESKDCGDVSSDGLCVAMKQLTPYKGCQDQPAKQAPGDEGQTEGDNLGVAPLKELSAAIVKVSNITVPYSKDLLTNFLNGVMVGEGFITNGNRVVEVCGDFESKDSSILIALPTMELAEKLCGLDKCTYILKDLLFELVSDCRSVTISNLPSPFIEELFLMFINHTLDSEKVARDPDTDLFVTTCSPFDESNSSVVVKFTTQEIAEKVCELDGRIKFLNRLLAFSMQQDNKAHPSIGLPQNLGKEAGNGVSDAPYSSSHISETSSNEISKFRNDWPGFETCKLLQFCIQSKHNLKSRSSRDNSEGWRHVMDCMYEIGLFYTVTVMKSRLKGLLSWYPRAAPDWAYRSLIEEYKGLAPCGSGKVPSDFQHQIPATSQNTKKSKNSYCCAIVLDGAREDGTDKNFVYEQDLLLISEYKRLKSKFDDSISRSGDLYAVISQTFRTANYSPRFTPEVLSNRMAYLAGEFKRRYDALKNKTGSSSDPRLWVYWDEMSQLFEGSVILKPQKVASWGYLYEQKRRDIDVQQEVQSGRKRNGNLQATNPKENKSSPPTSMKQERLQTAKGLLEQLTRFNDISSGKI